ncbi:MAG: DUF3300 domain-containing protein [Burkholderiales bacterium]
MRKFFFALFALALAAPPALAQERTPYTQAELDQMLAPIALYPDSLLSQVLMASTYPLEVVEAARLSRAQPGLQGDAAVRAADDRDWDPSVKSLLAFPKLLARMDEQLDWTKRLGDAFLEQEPHVMETVQQLRRRARAAGQLAPDERLRVADDGGSIVIEPANPQVVYVPYYDPLVVYGSWWWPAYPPVAWAPWPGYVAYRPGIWWGTGVGISAGFFFGGVSWSQRQVVVARVSPYYVRPRAYAAPRPIVVGPWRHDPGHRAGVVYRSPEQQRRFAPDARAPRAAPPRWTQPRNERRDERPAISRVERRGELRDDRRDHAMPPAFRASPPVAAEPRPRAQPTPSVQAPRQESRPQFRAQPRERGGERAQPRERGGERGGGWQRQADRAGRRG